MLFGRYVEGARSLFFTKTCGRDLAGERESKQQRIRGVTSRGRVAIARREALKGKGEGEERTFSDRTGIRFARSRANCCAEIRSAVNSRCDVIGATMRYTWNCRRGGNEFVYFAQARASPSTTSVRHTPQDVTIHSSSCNPRDTRTATGTTIFFFIHRDNFN